MRVLESLNEFSRSRGIKYILIGGHAVGMHGYVRATRDIDIAVSKKDIPMWREAFSRLDYNIFSEVSAFIQFKSSKLENWQVDMMTVKDDIFEELISESQEKIYGETPVNLISLKHLIFMKLFALKSDFIHRKGKDLEDIYHLMNKNRISVKTDYFRQQCQEYGMMQVYDEIEKRQKEDGIF